MNIKQFRVGIIGYKGGIGSFLKNRLHSEGMELCCGKKDRRTYLIGNTEKSTKGMTEEEILRECFETKPDGMFVCVSNHNKGNPARDIILACVKNNIPVSTCDKLSFAYHAEELLPYIDLIGFDATCGGGTQMVSYLRDKHLYRHEVEGDSVINGTSNFILHGVATDVGTVGEMCLEAPKLGYSEKGETEPIRIFNAELDDVRSKICTLHNLALRGEWEVFLNPDMVPPLVLTPKDIETLSQEDHRVIVSFSNNKKPKKYTYLNGGFKVKVGKWYIQGGLRKVSGNKNLLAWLPGGVGNAAHIKVGKDGNGGAFYVGGPGAGSKPTTDALIDNLLKKMKKR